VELASGRLRACLSGQILHLSAKRFSLFYTCETVESFKLVICFFQTAMRLVEGIL
jgi:hypothetical protein